MRDKKDKELLAVKAAPDGTASIQLLDKKQGKMVTLPNP